MLCPMNISNYQESGVGSICVKEECAWWDGEGCCIQNLGYLARLMEEEEDVFDYPDNEKG